MTRGPGAERGGRAASELEDLQQRLCANERLLSTLIAILSARDPRLLEELRSVFASSDFATDDAGHAATETWRRISVELDATKTLMDALPRR